MFYADFTAVEREKSGCFLFQKIIFCNTLDYFLIKIGWTIGRCEKCLLLSETPRKKSSNGERKKLCMHPLENSMNLTDILASLYHRAAPKYYIFCGMKSSHCNCKD